MTIDNSEWIFARAYDEALDRDDAALAARLGEAYVDYMERVVVYLDEALEDEAYASPDTYVGPGGITWLHRWAITRNVDRSLFSGEPAAPRWAEEIARIRE